MNEAHFRALIDDHARFPAALLAVFQGADEQLMREREAEKKWSPLEILAHLRDEEKLDFRARARCAIQGTTPDPIDPQGWVTQRKYNEMDPGEVYLDFAAERADSCRWLSTLSIADLEPSLEHALAGTMRAGDFIAAWRLHDLLHMRQFAHAMAVNTSRRLAGWKTRYAGDL